MTIESEGPVYAEAGRKYGYFIARVDPLRQVIARLSPVMDNEIEAETALRGYLRRHLDACIVRDLVVRSVRGLE